MNPSKALLLAETLLNFQVIRRVFDAGTGNGRNAVHLAARPCTVVGADFSPLALLRAQDLARRARLDGRTLLVRLNLLEELPFDDGVFDLCLDSYVSCHFLENVNFLKYWHELSRVVRKDGYIFTSMFATDDEYLAGIKDPEQFDGYRIVTDPRNGITKRVLDETQFETLFPKPLEMRYLLKFQFSDMVVGEIFRRSLLIAILQKPA